MRDGRAQAPVADRARPSVPLPPALGTVLTFYSYKGGVGRSMALANVTALLARDGKRTLVVDLDLEAPGIEKYFRDAEPRGSAVGTARGLSPGARATKPGMVDLIEAWQRHTASDPVAAQRLYEAPQWPAELDWRSCLHECRPFAEGEAVHVLSAGREEPAYARRVQALDWNVLFASHEVGLFFERLRDEWRRSYDLVLVDSRTGLSDSGSVCTSLLADQLVVFFTANEQSIDGVLAVARGAREAQKTLLVPRSGLPVVPVPARDEPYNEKELSERWRAVYATKFAEFYEEWAVRQPDEQDPGALAEPVPPETVLNRIYVPYASYWSFGERLPVLEQAERQNPAKIGAAFDRLASLLGSGLTWSEEGAERGALDLERARAQVARAQIETESRRAELETTYRASARQRWIAVGVLAVLVVAALGLYAKRARDAARVEALLLGLESARTLSDVEFSYAQLEDLLPGDDPRLLSSTTKLASLYVPTDAERAFVLFEQAAAIPSDELGRFRVRREAARVFLTASRPELALAVVESAAVPEVAPAGDLEAWAELEAELYESLPEPRIGEAQRAWARLVDLRCSDTPASDACIRTRTSQALFLARQEQVPAALEAIRLILEATDQTAVLADKGAIDLSKARRFPALPDALRAYEAILRLDKSTAHDADLLKDQIERMEALSRPALAPSNQMQSNRR